MCGGMTYKYRNEDTKRLEDRRVFFSQPYAQISVVREDGEVSRVQFSLDSSPPIRVYVPVKQAETTQ